MKNYLKTFLTLLIISILITGCSNSNENKTIDELISHFEENGLKGSKTEKFFALVGAIDGCGFVSPKINIEIYKFEDLENMNKGALGKIPYQNGSFGMIIHKPSENERTNIIDIFNSFGKTANKRKKIEKEIENKPSIDKKFITFNSIQIGDNIKDYNNFILSDDGESFFEIYINQDKTTVNKLEGNLKLFVLNSVIEKIQFDSEATFLGSTQIAGALFDEMLKERKKWIREAMLNYGITEWDDSKKISQYVNQGFLHQYDLNKLGYLNIQTGWKMTYIITSKNALKKEKQGKINSLDFGSNKRKKDIKNNTNYNKDVVLNSNSQNNKESQTKKFFITNVDNLRVRTSPNLDSEKIGNLAIGSKVEFIEKSNNQATVTIKNNKITEYWYKVKTPSGKIGWIHGCCFDK